MLGVLRRPTTPAEKRQLAEHLLEMSRPPHRLELTIVVQPHIRPWRYPPPMDFQYGDWLQPELERGEVEPAQPLNPDLTLLIAKTQLASEPLFGPPATELLDPIPRADVVRASVAGIDGLLADLGHDTRNVILTLARIWSTVETGAIRSKDGAADWALERLSAEQQGVLARARRGYVRGEAERWDDLAPAQAYAQHVVAEIRRAARNSA